MVRPKGSVSRASQLTLPKCEPERLSPRFLCRTDPLSTHLNTVLKFRMAAEPCSTKREQSITEYALRNEQLPRRPENRAEYSKTMDSTLGQVTTPGVLWTGGGSIDQWKAISLKKCRPPSLTVY